MINQLIINDILNLYHLALRFPTSMHNYQSTMMLMKYPSQGGADVAPSPSDCKNPA